VPQIVSVPQMVYVPQMVSVPQMVYVPQIVSVPQMVSVPQIVSVPQMVYVPQIVSVLQLCYRTIHFHPVHFKTQPHTILAPEPLLLPLNLYHIISKTTLRRNKQNDNNSYSTHCLSPFCIKFHHNQHSAIYDLL
jgi:hypothetical protein